jgi:mono/diheme cytochrome c family protein
LYVVDVFGNKELLFRDPAISCFLPMPLRARPRPPIITGFTDPKVTHATCLLTDAAVGMEGVEPGAIRYLRIAEPVGWPYDLVEGGHRYGEDHRYAGPEADRRNLANWTPVRILGDVPVEPDGSAHFAVPADTAVYFQLLDEQRRELRRMRSFISFQPGEVRTCTGCHESRAAAPGPPRAALAARRPVAVPDPPPWGDRPVNFRRDIQPVLDRHCVRCHRGLKPAGGLDFFGGLTSHDPGIPGYGYNRAYETILRQDLVAISKVRQQDASITPPLAYGSRRSRLLTALEKEPHTHEVCLAPADYRALVTWIDANAPYHDGFVNKRAPQPAYDLAADQALADKLAALHEPRCGSCHTARDVARLDWIHLSAPEESLFLRAPLSGAAGGHGTCPESVYASTTDAGYQAVLTLVTEAVQRAWAQPRRDLVRPASLGERQAVQQFPDEERPPVFGGTASEHAGHY